MVTKRKAIKGLVLLGVVVILWNVIVTPTLIHLTRKNNQPIYSLTQSVLKLDLFNLGVDDELLPLGSGSCFIVAQKDGYWYAITAKHCVEDVDPWSGAVTDIPRLMIGDTEVELLRKDSDADVALIRIKDVGQDYHILKLARPVMGEPCTTIGWTRGILARFKGHVAGLGFELGDQKYTIANSGLFPGCSGGPLLNADREVIGVTVAVPYSGGVWDTVGCFVPVRFVRSLMETIK